MRNVMVWCTFCYGRALGRGLVIVESCWCLSSINRFDWTQCRWYFIGGAASVHHCDCVGISLELLGSVLCDNVYCESGVPFSFWEESLFCENPSVREISSYGVLPVLLVMVNQSKCWCS